MTGCKVVCLHSAFGLTEGVLEFADLLRAEGCEVTTPDFYAGRSFDNVADGVAHRDEVGYRELLARVAEADVDGAVLIGFSLGASFAQRLARPGVRLVALIGSLDPLPPEKLWCGVDVQLHQYADDPWVDDEDVPPFRLAVEGSGAMFEHFVTPGDGHLFTERTQREYDRELTELTVDRIVAHLP